MDNKLPDWLKDLLDRIATSIKFYGKNFFGYRIYGGKDYYKVKIYPIPSEIYGGKDDGKRITCPFRLDISNLTPVFDNLISVYWDTDSRETVLEGDLADRSVTIWVMENPPEDQNPDELIDTLNGGTRRIS
jgi:hypothetical protein